MATRSSSANGLASDPSVWGGAVPVEGDKVNISHEVTLDGPYVWGDDSATAININSGGTLKASRSVSSTLTCKGTINVNSGGSLDYGKEADPVPDGVTARIRLNYSAVMASMKYWLELKDNSGFWTFGALKAVNTTLAAEALAGSSVIQVADASGWKAGDRIALASTAPTHTQAEDRIIQSIDGSTAALTVPLAYTHAPGGYIGNLTHNVVIESYNPGYPSAVNGYYNNLQGEWTREHQYTEFANGGSSSSVATYGCLSIWCGTSASARTRSVYKKIADCSFRNTEGGYGLLHTGNVKERIQIEDCAFYGTVGSNAIGEFQGATLDFSRCVVYRSQLNGVASSYSQGGQNCRHFDCVFSGANGSGFACTCAINPEFHRCKFLSSVRFANVSAGAEALFKDCAIGIGPGAPGFSGTSLIQISSSALNSLRLVDCDVVDGMPIALASEMALANTALKIVFANKNGDPLLQETYTPTGNILRGNFEFRTSAPSVRMEPLSSSDPLSFDMYVFAPNNSPVVVSGYIRKNAAYGSSNPPFVTLSGLGVAPDAYQIADIDDQWQQFKVQATQTTGTDGMLTLTFTVQSGGAGATVWIDDVTAPAASAVNAGEFSFWANALPVQSILANFVSAADVWNMQADQLTLLGSIGQRLADNVDAAVSSRLAASSYTAPDNAGIAEARIDAAKARKALTNRAVVSGDRRTVTIYDDDGTTPLFQFDVSADKLSRTPA
jgi:hypothetical protein